MELPTSVVDLSLDLLEACDRVVAQTSALKLKTLETLRAATTSEMDFRAMRAEIAAATRRPERTVDREMSTAYTLVHELPATFEALDSGRLTLRHAQIMVEECTGIPEELRDEWEARALREVHRSTGDFARTVKRLRARLAPESAVERHEEAKKTVDVTLEPLADGMACISAILPAPEAVAIFARIDQIARAAVTEDPELRIGLARGRALADRLLGREPDGPRLGDVRAQVVLTVPVLTLLDRTLDGRPIEPAELEGYGPIDPITARILTSECPELRRALVDPHTGVILSLGTERYRPSADLKLWLRLRDARCTFDGCSRRAEACDVDHVVDWAKGGRTDAGNLELLCPSHHALKTETAWRPTLDDSGGDGRGTVTWLSPIGRRYPRVVGESEPP